MKRIFVAINLNHGSITDFKRRLKLIQTTICDCSIKWIEPENVHLTLAFLGDVDKDRVGDLRLELEKNTKDIKSFDLHIQGVGVFPNIRRPRILWLGIKDHQELFKLERRIRKSLDNLHIKYDRKPFSAHLSIARLKRQPKANTILLLKHFTDLDCGKIKVTSTEIMSSRLERSGTKYTIEEKISLK